MDALLLRFNIRPNDLPTKCPAIKCQDDLTLSHADKYPFGGFVIRRGDYVKTVLAQHAKKAFGPCSVVVEPSLGHIENGARDAISGNINSQAREVFFIKNFNGMQTVCYFDVRVFTPTCDSNKNYSMADYFSKMKS